METTASEEVLVRENPSMFRNRPVTFLLTCLACLVGVGIPILLIWWLKVKATTLTVTDRRTILRHGLLSKYENYVLHEHVRNVRTRQSFFQRIMHVGRVDISSAGQGGIEISVKGIPNPDEIRELVDSHRLAQSD